MRARRFYIILTSPVRASVLLRIAIDPCSQLDRTRYLQCCVASRMSDLRCKLHTTSLRQIHLATALATWSLKFVCVRLASGYDLIDS